MPVNESSSITTIDDLGELFIGEYKMNIKEKQKDEWTVEIYNLDTKETVEVPYEVYFKKFRELLKQLSKKFKVEENNGQVNEPAD